MQVIDVLFKLSQVKEKSILRATEKSTDITQEMEELQAPKSLSPPIPSSWLRSAGSFSPSSRKHVCQQPSFTVSQMKEFFSPRVDMLTEKHYSSWPYLGHTATPALLFFLVRSV